MPSSWGKKGTVRVHLGPCAPGLFHPPRPLSRPGGSIEKRSDSWEMSLEPATHPEANSSLSAVGRRLRLSRSRAGRHSSGTVGRETATPPTVTTVQRAPNPLRGTCRQGGRKRLSERVFQRRRLARWPSRSLSVASANNPPGQLAGPQSSVEGPELSPHAVRLHAEKSALPRFQTVHSSTTTAHRSGRRSRSRTPRPGGVAGQVYHPAGESSNVRNPRPGRRRTERVNHRTSSLSTSDQRPRSLTSRTAHRRPERCAPIRPRGSSFGGRHRPSSPENTTLLSSTRRKYHWRSS